MAELSVTSVARGLGAVLTPALGLAVAATFVLAGCPADEDDCEGGARVGGRCVPGTADGGGDAGPDAGGDAGRDAGVTDAGADAALPECEPACSGATPFCDRDRLRCTECLVDADCSVPLPRCHPAALVCVLCLEAADCTDDPARPACDFPVNECVGCRDGRDCDPRSLAPRCDAVLHTCGPCEAGGPECASLGACFVDGVSEGDDVLAESSAGACVDCNEDADCESEDDCDLWAHECVIARGNVAWCEPCFADGDCLGGEACVVVRWPPPDGAVAGTVCARGCSNLGLYPDGDALCAGEVGRGVACVETAGRDGLARSACLPGVTSCEAFRDAAEQAPCASAADCGAGGLDDGTCVAGEDTCTFTCESLTDCPEGFDVCDGVPQRCRSAG